VVSGWPGCIDATTDPAKGSLGTLPNHLWSTRLEDAHPTAETAVREHSGITTRAFRPDIEGLRAIAVLLVLGDHAGIAVLSGGYIGVDVFFVLSGFLITGLLVKEIEQTGSVSLLGFYARRARRLFPAGMLVLVVTVISSYQFLGASRADRVAEDARWAALFASNVRFIRTGTDYLGSQLPPSPLQHYWSLAVEEQFYLVWPALILLLSAPLKRIPVRIKLGGVLLVIIVASFLWSMHQTRVDGTTAYFSPFTRAFELGAGALLAVCLPWVDRVPRRMAPVATWIGLAGILITAHAFTGDTHFPGYVVALPVMATVLVVLGGTRQPGTTVERILALPPIQAIGKLSYSLYLWHWPVLIIGAGWAGRDLSVVENLILCVLALGLSALTFVLVENPVRNATVLKRSRPLTSVAIGACLIMLAFGVAEWKHEASRPNEDRIAVAAALPSNYATAEDVATAVAEGVSVQRWPEQPARIANPAKSKRCNVTRKDTTSAVCVHGDPNGAHTLVVYGDSHGDMWMPALDLIGKQAGWQIIQLTKPACQAPDFPRYSDVLKREYSECSKFRSFALHQIASLQPDLVLITSEFKLTELSVDGKPTTEGLEDAWSKGLASVIDQIAPNAGKIIVIGDMAYPEQPGIDCLTAHEDNVPACNTSREKALYADHNGRERQVAEQHGAAYLDVIPWFCTDTVCPAVVAGLTTHRDAYHVSENYAVWLAGVLGEAIGILPSRQVPERQALSLNMQSRMGSGVLVVSRRWIGVRDRMEYRYLPVRSYSKSIPLPGYDRE
jgi:peptidoglycan/LPS O-acetylase OafA/YrhL